MADGQLAVAYVADPVTVKVGLVRVERIRAIVYWAGARRESCCIGFKSWVAKTVTVRVGTRVAEIRKCV
jgi:hypothetical protein